MTRKQWNVAMTVVALIIMIKIAVAAGSGIAWLLPAAVIVVPIKLWALKTFVARKQDQRASDLNY